MDGFFPSLSRRFALLILVAFGLLLALPLIPFRSLESGDESRVAGISAEMACSGDPVLPRLNGEPFLEYPPGFYWLAASSLKVFGNHDFAAEIPSPLIAVVSAVILFLLALELKFSPAAALTSGVILLTGAQFFGTSRKCVVDLLLAFFVLLSYYSFYAFTLRRSVSARAGFFFLFAFALAGGVFTKGLLGFALPLSGLGVWCVLSDCRERRFRFSRYFVLAAAALLAAVPVAVWIRALYLDAGPSAVKTLLMVNGIGRATGSQGDHVVSVFYYFTKLPELFWPWLPFLLISFFFAIREIRRGLRSELLLPLCFLFIPFLLLNIAAAKRMVYLVPLYAPCALLSAWLIFEHSGPVSGWLAARIPASRRACAGLLALTLLLAVFLIVDSVMCFQSRRHSLRPLFEQVRALERQGCSVRLLGNSERTRGASFFYLNKVLPVDAQIDLSVDPGRNYWIVRQKRFPCGESFADSHVLFSLREYLDARIPTH